MDQHPERIEEIRETISQHKIDWEDVVRLSSGQFVLPAFYLQMKRNGLILYLPTDLTDYLSEMTELNHKRNLAILDQAKEITLILNAHNITPVFLKGTAHLLDGLYNNIAERMLGDIDFLVREDKMVEAAEILIREGYKPLTKYKPEMFRKLKHYPRLQNFNRPASVEIHKEVLNPSYQKLLRGIDVLNDKTQIETWDEEAFIPSIQHLVIHNVFNAQLNDKAQVYGNILLRQMYDLFQLSLSADVLAVAQNHKKKFNTFNSYFAAISYVFSSPDGIYYQDTLSVRFYKTRLKLSLSYPFFSIIYKTIIFLSWRISRYISIPIISIFRKNARKLLMDRITDPKWYRNHIKSYRAFFKH
ncbi:MAG: nucleotidyltransferase family protein [Prolixibacteraceae bacterium]|nr:nucleotidyltransferase family protein [Prolixibacteraceae bacterium]